MTLGDRIADNANGCRTSGSKKQESEKCGGEVCDGDEKIR